MALITWSPIYAVGILDIDTQHRTLVNLLNQLHEAMTAGHGKDVLGKILTELVSYTKVHFGNEEKLMREQHYPAFAGHKQQHDQFTAEVLRFKASFDAGKANVSLQLLQFLKSWLIQHIQGSDTEMAAHLKGAPVH